MDDPQSRDNLEEVSASEFSNRFIRAIEKLKSYKPAEKMRRLGIALELGYDSMSDSFVIYPIGLEKVSKLIPEVGAIGFMDIVLDAAGVKKGEATPEKLMKKFPNLSRVILIIPEI